MVPWSLVFPEKLSNILHIVESWISSIFIFLAIITIGPWLLFLLYDLLLYIFRTFTYELPVIGGRARGRERPRAPSLRERPTGDPRLLGIGVPVATYLEDEEMDEQAQRNRESIPESRSVRADSVAGHDGREQHYQASPLASEIGHGKSIHNNNDEQRNQSGQIFGTDGIDERMLRTEDNTRRRVGFKDEGSVD